MSKCRIDIAVADERWCEGFGDVRSVCRKAARAALRAGDVRPPSAGLELSIRLADDVELRDLNRDYRGIDRPTNVLAFPNGAAGSDGASPQLVGDVVLAYETVCTEARVQQKNLEGHLAHLVVHGTLHLSGFDHDTTDEAVRMEAAETATLHRLGYPNPYGPDAEQGSTQPDCGVAR